MGFNTTANGASSTAMGQGTIAGGDSATAMGAGTTANGTYSIAMGHLTSAGGFASTAMGKSTTANGAHSLAAGTQARALHDGTFVWADNRNADFASTGSNQFLIRASGGVGINNNNPNGAALAVGGDVNVEGVVSVNALSAGSVTTTQITGNAGGLTDVPVNALSISGAPTNSSIVAWGYDAYGQATVPNFLQDAAAISVGGFHNLALKRDGTVVAWGNGAAGQTNVPPGLSSVSAISAGGNHSLALKTDGTVAGWGNGGASTPPVGLNNVSAISAGGQHNLALRTDGTVVTWGFNGNGQTNMPPGVNNVAAIAAGGAHSLALKSNGTVVAWGFNGSGQTNVPAGLSNVKAIAAGYLHSLALKHDGTVVAWGGNGAGQTNVPAGLGNVIAIAAGYGHNLALKSDGTVVAWGDNSVGQTNVPVMAGRFASVAPGCAANHVLALVPRAQSPVAWLDADNTFNGNVQFNGVIDGKVGINTVPQQVLHVNVPHGKGEGMQIDCATEGHSPAIYLNHTGNAGRKFRLASFGDNSTPGSFIIRDDTAGADRFTIDANGVLIGNGAGLTGLDASKITNGFLSSSRLEFNVARLDSSQTFTASKAFAPSATLSFGSTLRQMLNLWSTNYGIGVQTSSLYFRCDSGSANDGFIWYKGGAHHDGYANAGGGLELMHLVDGGLFVRGTYNNTSDRDAKENFSPVNASDILEKVVALPISRWNYRHDAATPHLGPVAQDFHAAFGVGPDDKHIATVDADGVALAAIQGLNQKVEEQRVELKQKETEITKLQQRLEALEKIILNQKPNQE
jgi:hypothetical protein